VKIFVTDNMATMPLLNEITEKIDPNGNGL
jgi:hypothetical protein